MVKEKCNKLPKDLTDATSMFDTHKFSRTEKLVYNLSYSPIPPIENGFV